VKRALVACIALIGVLAAAPVARAQMDLSQVSGQPLPSPDLPAGTVSVRVIRGTVTNNVAGQPVDITVDGKMQRVTTDGNGRAQVSGLRTGAQVKAATVVDGQRIESKDFSIGSTGIRVMLVAGLAAPGAPAASAGAAPVNVPPVAGTVTLGPESRVVAEFVEDRLNVYYLMDIVNAGPSPVTTGGPITIDLPREARGAFLLQDSSKQATISGAHVVVVGPFMPGRTPVRAGFEMPVRSGVAHISSKLPVALPQLIVIVQQVGGLDLESRQLTAKRDVTDQGERILAATGPAIAAGQTLDFSITGIPHHADWPRYLALALAGTFMTAGLWAGFAARPSRRKA
jgi:hypothetical protein